MTAPGSAVGIRLVGGIPKAGIEWSTAERSTAIPYMWTGLAGLVRAMVCYFVSRAQLPSRSVLPNAQWSGAVAPEKAVGSCNMDP